MNNKKTLYSGLTDIAVGYLLILININFGGWDVLPDFVGYTLFADGIKDLKNECTKIILLRPFAIILAIYEFISWLSPVFQPDIGNFSVLLTLIISIISLYFSFQLLTELSLLAQKYQNDNEDLCEKLKKRRNIHTVILTVIHVGLFVINDATILKSEISEIVFGTFAFTEVIVAFMIAVTLFSIRKLFEEKQPQDKRNNHISEDTSDTENEV